MFTDKIDISIVLGTYNRINSLKQALTCFLNSAIPKKFEIIINDAGSTDGTIEYLKSIKNNNIIPIFGNKNGVTNAYNNCFKQARGKFVTWLSDDEIIVDNGLFVMCNLMESLSKNDMGAFKMKRMLQPELGYFVPMINSFPCPYVGCMYTETLKKYNYWNIDFLYYAQDQDICSKIYRMGGKIVSCEAFINHYSIKDLIKETNVTNYLKSGGSQKFYVINRRFGQYTGNINYSICFFVTKCIDIKLLIYYINRVKSFYSTADLFITFKNDNSEIQEIQEIQEIPFNYFNLQNYDLILQIENSCMSNITPYQDNESFYKNCEFSKKLCANSEENIGK